MIEPDISGFQPVSAQGSFDFEQENEGGNVLASDEDGEEGDEWNDSDGWGSEFDDDDEDAIDAEFSAEADRTGQLSVADLVHRVYWEGEMDIDDETASNDKSGRFKYLLECRRTRTRPTISIMIAMEGDRLQLQHQGLRQNEAKALAAAFSCNESVTHLNLSHNPLGTGAVDIAAAMADNSALTRLDMRSAQVGWRGAEEFGKSLYHNEYLTHLDLRSNKIGDSGLARVALALKDNQTLRFLDVSDNEGSIKAASALAHVLPANGALTHLDLSWNHIRPQELRLLSEGVLANSTLSSLSLAWNGVGDKREPEPQQHDEKEAMNKSIDKSESPKKVAAPLSAGEVLAHLISQTTTLQHLDMTNCRIGERVARELANAIRSNGSLKSIRLDGNPLGSGASEVMSALQKRSDEGTIQNFSLANCSVDVARATTVDYDNINPSGSYRLDLAQSRDQEVLKLLMRDARASRGEMWRNERINGIRFLYPALAQAKWVPPAEGVLEVDLLYYDKNDQDLEPVDEEDFRRLTRALEECKTESSRLSLLKRACQAYMFSVQQALGLLFLFSLDSTRENVVVIIFGRLTDRNRLCLLEPALSHRSRLQLHKRIGPLWLMHRQSPAGKYWMDLGKMNDRRALFYLLELRIRAPSCSFINVKYTAHAGDSALPLTEASPLYEILVKPMPVSMTTVEGVIPTEGHLEFDFTGDKTELGLLARAAKNAIKGTGSRGSPFDRSLRSREGSRSGSRQESPFNLSGTQRPSLGSGGPASPGPLGSARAQASPGSGGVKGGGPRQDLSPDALPAPQVQRFPTAEGVTGSSAASRGGSAASSSDAARLSSSKGGAGVPMTLPESTMEGEEEGGGEAKPGHQTAREPQVERPTLPRRGSFKPT